MTNIEALPRYPDTREATGLKSVRKRLLHAGEHSGQACCYVESEATPAADGGQRGGDRQGADAAGLPRLLQH